MCTMYALKISNTHTVFNLVGTIAQTADLGVRSSIPARSYTFVEIDHKKNLYSRSPILRSPIYSGDFYIIRINIPEYF